MRLKMKKDRVIPSQINSVQLNLVMYIVLYYSKRLFLPLLFKSLLSSYGDRRNDLPLLQRGLLLYLSVKEVNHQGTSSQNKLKTLSLYHINSADRPYLFVLPFQLKIGR